MAVYDGDVRKYFIFLFPIGFVAFSMIVKVDRITMRVVKCNKSCSSLLYSHPAAL